MFVGKLKNMKSYCKIYYYSLTTQLRLQSQTKNLFIFPETYLTFTTILHC